jgi:hypothetical protein
MKIRVICQSSTDGDLAEEYLTFLDENFDGNVNEYLIPGCSIDSDKIVEVENWPNGFPFNYTFKRDE